MSVDRPWRTLDHMAPSRDPKQNARRLADAHRAIDPQLKTVYFVPTTQDEVAILEVSDEGPPMDEIFALKFTAAASENIYLPSTIAVVHSADWEKISAGKLALPPGWPPVEKWEQVYPDPAAAE